MTSRIAAGVALCAVPTLLAVALLVLGVSIPELTLVYASIAASLLALPAFVVGVVLIVQAVRR
jgi:hypothetical protein